MKLFTYIERINLMHKLITQRRTGTPEELARRLSISVSRLYTILDELKLMGAPIVYSRQRLTYYYSEPFDINISVEFRALGGGQVRNISGGQRLFSDSLFTAFFV